MSSEREPHRETAEAWDIVARSKYGDELRLRPGVGYFDDAPRENPGFPASVVARRSAAEGSEEPGTDRPRMLERPWRPGEVIEALLARGLEYAVLARKPGRDEASG